MQEVDPQVLFSLGSQEKSLFFSSLKIKFRGGGKLHQADV